MQLTIVLPDEIGRRIERLPNPSRFIAEVLAKALPVEPVSKESSTPEPSRWAKLAQQVAEDPVHLDGYSQQLERDSRTFRDEFAFRHDRDS